MSLRVHALPSLQPEPSSFAGLLQMPVVGSHTPALWHWSEAVQVTGFVPTQAPPWQESVSVQALLSLHAVPFGLAGVLHAPVAGLQVPTS